QVPFSFVGDIIDPLGYALLAPAPWQAQSLSELGASAEMPVWYALLVASFFSWRAAPRSRLFVICLAVYAIANWLILAAVEGNLGNLLRHRLMLDPPLLILGGAGLYWLWQRARALPIQVAKLPDHQRGDSEHEGAPHHERDGSGPGNAARGAVGAAHAYSAEPAVGRREQRQRHRDPEHQ